MKILLIDTPFSLEEVGGKKQSFKHVLNKIPSLGLAYLAAAAEKNGHEVKIFDFTLGEGYKELVNITRAFNPKVVGITAATPTFKNAARTANLLREIIPDAVFVCGGAHPTAMPMDAMNSEAFDFIVLGEGEKTFLELIFYLDNQSDNKLEDIRGIAFKKENKVIITPRRELIDDLDSLPFPARHLLRPLKVYQPTPASYIKLPVIVVMSSRGCPSRCTFCDRAVFGERFRKRSADNLMAEIEEGISRYGAKEVRFFDDTFTFDHTHVQDVCNAMKKLRPLVPWTCLTRVTAVNPDMLRLMREAGCWQVLFGLESGDDDILKYLGKGNTVFQNRQAVSWAREAGLSVRADFLIGSPWETKQSFEKTIEFAKSLPLDFAHFNKFVPYPGTVIYKELTAKGYGINFDKGSYINNHSDFTYIPEAFTSLEYTSRLNYAYKSFYLRPSYLMRRLLSMKTFTELVGNLKGAYSIMSL